ncbi:MAG: DUF2807 domain-containing protein [Chitinophagaceae bacterium]|nr:DUF2807 domain-containing protein [Chitinophagaceae bacterium]
MQLLKLILPTILVASLSSGFSQKSINVKHFDKAIISPFISVTFVEGSEEMVSIENCTVDHQLVNVEVNGTTLRIYLEGYGTVLKATVTYKSLADVSIRGEEPQVFKSALKGSDFRLKVYGTSEVTINEVDLDKCHAILYGDGSLSMLNGRIDFQQYTVYGTGSINSLAIKGNSSKITSYGEADFYVNVSDQIKINAFGEASLHYTGDALVSKGIQIGEMRINKLK